MESAENQPQSSPERPQTKASPVRSKMETISLLNASIDKLEETIRRISEDSVQIPANDSMDNLLNTAQELEDAVTAIEAKITTPPAPQVAAPSTPAPSAPAIETTAPSASPKSPTAKPIEPVPAKPKKNKNIALIITAVTAVAIAVVTLFWLQPEFISNLLPQESAPVPKVAVGLDRATEKLVEQPIVSPTGEIGTAVESTPETDFNIVRDISAMDFPEEIESVAEPIEDVVETIIPTELTSPSKPKNLKMVAVKPELNFTPEQNLLAALENRVAALTQVEESEFVRDVRVNRDRSLLVRVTDDWYELDEASQNDLGDRILQRSRRFSFDKLELKDKDDVLVARSPIIGNNIILQTTEE